MARPIWLGMGAEENDPKPRYANLSWITADQIYLARVTPSPENINDVTKYEFFAGHDAAGKPVWTQRLRRRSSRCWTGTTTWAARRPPTIRAAEEST